MTGSVNYITLILGYAIPISVYFLLKSQKSTLGKSIIKATLMMSIQLTAAGFLLTLVFNKNNVLITSLYVVSMLLFAFRTIYSRVNDDFKYKKEALIVVTISSLLVLIYLIFIISFSSNSLSPRYVIPIFGMVLGNIITAIVLGCNELDRILNTNKSNIISLLDLGVDINTAVNEQLGSFTDTAISPTLTLMLSIGVVSLPGIMTGQILGGASPISAVSYQLVIMFGILGSITLGIISLKVMITKKIINKYKQLVY